MRVTIISLYVSVPARERAEAAGRKSATDAAVTARRRCRTGLVGADDGDGAQRLDGGQLADDGVVLGHLAHADGEDDGDDGGQALGDNGDGDTDGDAECLRQLNVAGAPGDEEGGDADDDDADAEDAAKHLQ